MKKEKIYSIVKQIFIPNRWNPKVHFKQKLKRNETLIVFNEGDDNIAFRKWLRKEGFKRFEQSLENQTKIK